jgi:CRISPR/Cas system-associated endoribonuclease Cas2
MIEERRRSLDTRKKLWLSLAGELNHIIAYIRDNLAKIVKLSEESIVILVSDQISRKKEGDLIEDIKAQFKDRLRESLHQGTITKAQLEEAKEEVAGLSKRAADLVRADVYALTELYEAIHEYSGSASRHLDIMMGAIESKKHVSFDEDLELYDQLEKTLVLLTSGCRFEIKATDIGAETEHDRILIEKRREMLYHLFDLLRKGSSS